MGTRLPGVCCTAGDCSTRLSRSGGASGSPCVAHGQAGPVRVSPGDAYRDVRGCPPVRRWTGVCCSIRSSDAGRRTWRNALWWTGIHDHGAWCRRWGALGRRGRCTAPTPPLHGGIHSEPGAAYVDDARGNPGEPASYGGRRGRARDSNFSRASCGKGSKLSQAHGRYQV